MGRSTETFNKKEREKKKLKKQQDKKERAEVRKNNTKGQGQADMMAYVDENGNITSVPQDTGARRKFSVEDIQISTAKQEDVQAETIRQGTVTFFNEAKGFGFIKDLQTQESIFVHINAVSYAIKENDKVTFEVEQGQKGLTAVKVAKAN